MPADALGAEQQLAQGWTAGLEQFGKLGGAVESLGEAHTQLAWANYIQSAHFQFVSISMRILMRNTFSLHFQKESLCKNRF